MVKARNHLRNGEMNRLNTGGGGELIHRIEECQRSTAECLIGSGAHCSKIANTRAHVLAENGEKYIIEGKPVWRRNMACGGSFYDRSNEFNWHFPRF